MKFRRTGSEEVFSGRIVTVEIGEFRFDDGEVVSREIVHHRGAVAIVAHDGERLWLVRQPREALGVDDLLELPAGKLDEEGEDPLATAQRELAEEIGKAAGSWEHLVTYLSSPGFSDERVYVYLATDLRDEQAEPDEDERLTIETVPLAELDRVIAEVEDAKTLIGLLWFRAFAAAG